MMPQSRLRGPAKAGLHALGLMPAIGNAAIVECLVGDEEPQPFGNSQTIAALGRVSWLRTSPAEALATVPVCPCSPYDER
jgi:hypothetical protein